MRFSFILVLFFFPAFLLSQDYFFYGEQLSDQIFRSDLDGGNVQSIVTGQGILRRMRIDFEEEKLFWVEGATGRLWKSNFDGTNQEILLDLPVSALNLIEIDKTNQRIFYTVTNDGFIRSIDLDGSNQQTVVSGVGNAQGMDYDPFCDKIYWTEFDTGTIKRASGDGTNVETILNLNSKPFDLVLDVESGKIFFSDRESSDVFRSNLDGSSLETIITQPGDKGAMTLDYTNERLYWVNNTQEVIYSADLDGNNITPVIIGNMSTTILAGVVAYVPFVENYDTPVFELPEDTILCAESGASLLLSIPQDVFVSQQWQDGTSAPTFEVTDSGTYWVNAFTVPGCVSTDTIEVELYENPELIIEEDLLICDNGILDLSVDAIYTSVIWQDTFNGNGVYRIDTSGTYWVSALSPEGCLLEDTIRVTVLSVDNNFLGDDLIICEGESTVIGQEIDGATYTWQDNSAQPFYIVSDPGTYSIELLTADGCVLNDTILVTVYEEPELIIDKMISICSGTFIDLSVDSIYTSVVWQDTFNGNGFYRINDPGVYWVTAMSAEGCILEDTISVMTLPTLGDLLGNDVMICEGSSIVIGEEVPGAQYIWQDNSNQPFFQVSEPGVYSLELITADGCRYFDFIEVTFYNNPELILEEVGLICENDSLGLSVDANYTSVIWQDTFSGGGIYSVSEPGIYWVSALSPEGCALEDTITIATFSTNEEFLGDDLMICEGDSVLIGQEIIGVNYIWQDSSTQPFYQVTNAGIYWAEILLEEGCSQLDSIVVSFFPEPEINLGNDTTICQDEQIFLEVLASQATYLWQDSSSFPFYLVDEAGIYSVEINQDGCVFYDSIRVNVIDCTICNIYVPNVFSPNADGLNDRFAPSSNCDFETYNLKIFNRWGALVFQSLNVQNTWDGSFKGEYFQPGVFVYDLEFSFINGQDLSTKRISGDITILK